MDLNYSLWSGATLRLPWENVLTYHEQCRRLVQCNADLLNNVKPNPSIIDVDHLLLVNCWVWSHSEFSIVCVTYKNRAYTNGLHKLNLVNHFPLMVITILTCLSHILSHLCVHSHADRVFLLSSFGRFFFTRLKKMNVCLLSLYTVYIHTHRHTHMLTNTCIFRKLNVSYIFDFLS